MLTRNKFIVLGLPEGKVIWSRTCQSGGADFETAVLFGGPRAIEYSQDGKWIFAVTREGGLVLDAETGALIAKSAVPVTAVACDLKDAKFAFASARQVEVYSTKLLKR